MGVRPAKFESAGKTSEHYIPGVYTRRHTVPAGSGVSSGNLCIIGHSNGGEPFKMYDFADKSEAKQYLFNGQLLDGVANAFNGSNDFVPQHVMAMRVNEGTQSSLLLKRGAEDIIKIPSADFGPHCNQLKLWLKKGTEPGTVRLIADFKGEAITADNIGQKLFSLSYIGEGVSASYAISNYGITLKAADGDGNVIDSYEFLWDDIETIYQLIAVINDTDAYHATTIIKDPDARTNLIDAVPSTEFEENAAIIRGDCTALINALKNISYFDSDEIELVENAPRMLPDLTDSYIYFTGGSEGAYTVEQWMKALTELEKYDIQCIATPSTEHFVHVLISDHCAEMSLIDKKQERQFIVGNAIGTSIDDTIAAASELNSEYGSLVFNSAIANDPFTTAKEHISGGMLACKIAGMEAALSPNNPVTNKVLKVNGFGEELSATQMNKLIKNGVLCCGKNDDGELVVIRAVTTLQRDNLALNERSMVREALYMDRDLRKAFSRKVGSGENPSESDILNILKNKANEWAELGYIVVGDEGLIHGASVKFDGDAIYLTYGKYLTAPKNFIFITSVNEVYTSTTRVK